MTIKEARKILGKLSQDVSDEQIEQDIHTAELLKELFFYTRQLHPSPRGGEFLPNMP